MCRWRRGSGVISKAAGREDEMLKVAIVGCGKIADAHASQIQRIKGCEIVGVCDREALMARQLSERFPVKRYFTDLTDRKSTRLNSSHLVISYAVFCLKKKKNTGTSWSPRRSAPRSHATH